MGILVCVYTGLLNMLQVRYWITAYFTFCLPPGAVEPVSVVLVVYSAHQSCDFYRPIQLFSNFLHFPHFNTEAPRNLRIGSSMVNAKESSILFSNFWRNELCCCAAFMTDSVQLTAVWYKVGQTRKQSAYAKLIN